MHARHKDGTNKVRLTTVILSPKCCDFKKKRFIGVYAKGINGNMDMYSMYFFGNDGCFCMCFYKQRKHKLHFKRRRNGCGKKRARFDIPKNA